MVKHSAKPKMKEEIITIDEAERLVISLGDELPHLPFTEEELSVEKNVWQKVMQRWTLPDKLKRLAVMEQKHRDNKEKYEILVTITRNALNYINLISGFTRDMKDRWRFILRQYLTIQALDCNITNDELGLKKTLLKYKFCNVVGCNYATKKVTDLKRHNVAKHYIGTKRHACTLCNHSSNSLPDMKKHKNYKHGIKRKQKEMLRDTKHSSMELAKYFTVVPILYVNLNQLVHRT